jgi:hypothetical protein
MKNENGNEKWKLRNYKIFFRGLLGADWRWRHPAAHASG